MNLAATMDETNSVAMSDVWVMNQFNQIFKLGEEWDQGHKMFMPH